MKLITGGINGNYLRDIIENAASETQEVLAAVAYATDTSLLFDWCWDNSIPLKFYGRLDEGVAVHPPVLRAFLQRKSARFQCRLVQHHHAKVIWWREYGLYIGSANLTQSAWYSNVEAGCFFPEEEISDEMASEITGLFDTLNQNSTPLTNELYEVMEKRFAQVSRSTPSPEDFWNSPSLVTWSGLSHVTKRSADDRRRQRFLEEWHATLQQLRDIGETVADPANRPVWVNADAPVGAQADQFLHAHYYRRTFEGRKAMYLDFFERNRRDPEAALNEAVEWWRTIPDALPDENSMLNETAPMLREALSEPALAEMTYESFRNICISVHAISDYARRVSNRSVGLKEDGTTYTILEKVNALSLRIWVSGSAGGKSIAQLLHYILYGGSDAELPERLYSGVYDREWKIEGLGVSALGEMTGWALPDRFPPRNGRTSKSLKSLGYDVTVHSG